MPVELPRRSPAAICPAGLMALRLLASGVVMGTQGCQHRRGLPWVPRARLCPASARTSSVAVTPDARPLTGVTAETSWGSDFAGREGSPLGCRRRAQGRPTSSAWKSTPSRPAAAWERQAALLTRRDHPERSYLLRTRSDHSPVLWEQPRGRDPNWVSG